jgi:hypothetical protein
MLSKKKIYIVLLFICYAAFSCDGSIIKLLNKELSSADNVKIYFYDKATGKMPGSGYVASINDPDEVKHFLATITEEDFNKRQDCVYNGQIEFFSGNKSIINMEFNMEPNCGFVIFKIRDLMQSKKLSEDGIKLLNFYYSKIAN